MVKNWLSDPLEKALQKYIPKVSGKSMNYDKQQKFISKGVKVVNFVTMILKAILYMWIFQKILNSAGFEVTAILLLTLIMIILRNKS